MIVQRKQLALIIGSIFLPLAGCAGRYVEYKDNTVEIRSRVSLLPHGSGMRTLVSHGKTFGHLYSYRYVSVPEWNAIVFVTNREGFKYHVHVFNPNTGNDTVIKTSESFGGGLGQPKNIYLDSVRGDVATFVEKGFMGPDIVYKLNRPAKTLVAVR